MRTSFFTNDFTLPHPLDKLQPLEQEQLIQLPHPLSPLRKQLAQRLERALAQFMLLPLLPNWNLLCGVRI